MLPEKGKHLGCVFPLTECVSSSILETQSFTKNEGEEFARLAASNAFATSMHSQPSKDAELLW